MKRTAVICDFDGTITKVDAINDFLGRYADKKWLETEVLWEQGLIDSAEALKIQFGLVENMTKEKFYDFFKEVELDDYFKEFWEFALKQEVKVAIVSDGFDLFIREILKANGITGIDIYSNALEYGDNGFEMKFPHKKAECRRKGGTCKCFFIKKFKQEYENVYYVGDGVSDYCVSKIADFIFAKKKLSDYCKRNKIKYKGISDFKEVIRDDRFKFNN